MILHPSHTPTHAPAQEARMTHILVIEDNPDLAFGLRNNLEIEGYEVTVAADGPSGLARALETSPDLVVLDRDPVEDIGGAQVRSTMLGGAWVFQA